MFRYYFRDYEITHNVHATLEQCGLNLAIVDKLRETYPDDIVYHPDGIETPTQVDITGLALFEGIATDATIEALKPKPAKPGRPPKNKTKPVTEASEPKKRGRPVNIAAKIAKKQNYLTWIETNYNLSDSLKYRNYLIGEWNRTKNEIEQITKNSTDTA